MVEATVFGVSKYSHNGVACSVLVTPSKAGCHSLAAQHMSFGCQGVNGMIAVYPVHRRGA